MSRKKEDQHIARVVRVLSRATNELARLARTSRRTDYFPKTTEAAYVDTLKVLHATQIRVAARSATAI